MDLRVLATFKMVATTLNFTQSAAALGYVQSTVTAHIQSLEAELGVLLFERLGKRVALTAAGERLLRYSQQLLALADETRRAVIGETADPIGTLTLSAPETLCTYRLPAVLHEFRARCPRVRVLFRPTSVSQLRGRVSEGSLDVALVLERPITSGGTLVVEPLVVEPMVLIAPPGHPLAGRAQVYACDLAGEAVLFTEIGCSYRNQFEHALIAAGVYPTAVLEFMSIEAIKQCVIMGMGLSILPRVAVEQEVAQGRLLALPWAEPLEIVTQLVWHKDKQLSPALCTFIDLTRQGLSSGELPDGEKSNRRAEHQGRGLSHA